MEKRYYGNDYGYGAHRRILERLLAVNGEARAGYGCDDITGRVEREILKMCGLEEGCVRFLAGGTQTNIVAIDWLLHPGEGVLCSEDAHINVHESGGIENCGHKVIVLPSEEGKIRAEDVDAYMESFYADATWRHKVRPGMVYISQPTELGTLYGLEELERLSAVCRQWDLRLYADGARLVYGLASAANDVSLQDMGRLLDAFYIGGTKAGTLFGEALVLREPDADGRFFTAVKRHGALLAKGWLAAVQFEVLLCEGLYREIGEAAIAEADSVSREIETMGGRRLIDSKTNQRFYEVENRQLQQLREKYVFEIWGAEGKDRTAVRFVTGCRGS